MTRDAWQAEQKQAKAFANAKAVAASGYRAGIKSQGRSYRDRRPSPRESEGVRGQDVGWFSGLAGGWHEPSAKAKAEATKVKAEAQKGSGRSPESPRRCRKGQGKGEEGSRPEGRQCCQPTDRRANQDEGFSRRVEEGTGAGERPCQEVGTLRRPNQRNRPQRRGKFKK